MNNSKLLTENLSMNPKNHLKIFLTICFFLTIFSTFCLAQSTLDPSFTGGVTDGLPQTRISARQTDGKIIVGGTFRTSNTALKPNLTRLNADGSVDATFNAGGSGPNSGVWDIVILSTGKILVGGGFSTYNGAATGALVRLNADGTLDPTFNAGGAGANFVQTIVLQTDGKILIANVANYNGTVTNSLARLNGDGSLDTSFVSRFPGGTFIEGLALDPDGKILVGGFFTSYDGAAVPQSLIKLNTDGTRDATFNAGGSGVNGSIFAIARQTDGKYVIAGSFGTYNGTSRFGIARVNADGSLDTSFVIPGLTQSTGDFVEIQADGKILVAGGFQLGATMTAFMRLNTNGSLDNSFQLLTADNAGYHSALQPDGKIILTGFFTLINNEQRGGVVRLNADGSIDSSFTASLSDLAIVSRLVQQTDGKILAAGLYLKANGAISRDLARYNLDGSLDASFNIGTGPAPGTSFTNSIEALAVQTNGKILIGGTFNSYNGTLRAGLARLNADGSLDTTFDPSFIFRFVTNTIFDIIPLPDGKIIVGGFIGDSATTRKFLYRLNTDGSIDTTFNAGGAGANSVVRKMIRQSDGKYIIVGQFTTYNGTPRNRVARLNADGTLDTSFDPGAGANSTVLDVTLQTNGKIVIAGQFSTYNSIDRNDIARLNGDGSLDTSFNIGTGSNGFIFTAAVLPNGKILAGGTFSDFNTAPSNRLVRLNADGSVDPSFNSGIENNAAYSIRAILNQLDGKVLLGGVFESYAGTAKNNLARLFTPETGGGTQPILFSTSRDSNFEIYKMNVDGTNQQRLTNSPENETIAYWSPDGAKIVFGKSISSTQVQIWTMNADGSNKTLISDATGVNNTQGWSPNGQKILYTVGQSNTEGKIWTMNPDGSNKTRLTNTALIDHIVSWSPDGSKISFGRCPVAPQLICDVFVMNADGSNQVNLTPTSTVDDDGARWTPDGRIVFGRGDDTSYNAFIMNSDGTNVHPLTNSASVPTYSPAEVSPSGNKVALTTQSGSLTSFEISTVGLDGTNLVNITNNSSLDIFGKWSPDGSKIAFRSRRDAASDEIYTMNADGSNVLRLTLNSATDSVTDWYRPRSRARAPFDFDGDGKTDVSIFRPSVGEWWYLRSTDLSSGVLQFGASTDRLAPADYTGDGKTDITFFRPSTGFWFILRSEDYSFLSFPFGASGDIPAPADYDGDGKADPAVFRPSTNEWFISNSGGGTGIVTFGASGDVPVTADYDGDGKSDIAIFRPSDGSWWHLRSSDGQFSVYRFGLGTDKPVQADYTGDGKADIAVFRPSTGEWFIQRSEDNSFFSFPFGASGDIPAPGDYDGDGKTDAAVFRPNGSTWFLRQSTAGIGIVNFGIAGDKPVPSAFVP
jgi:uncharacterized delta-60 repeat protein